MSGQEVGLRQRVAASLVRLGDPDLGQPEVEHLEVAVAVDHDVARFEIAVGHSSRVRCSERVDERQGKSTEIVGRKA